MLQLEGRCTAYVSRSARVLFYCQKNKTKTRTLFAKKRSCEFTQPIISPDFSFGEQTTRLLCVTVPDVIKIGVLQHVRLRATEAGM